MILDEQGIEENIETVSLLFVKKKALDNMHDYSEEFIFKYYMKSIIKAINLIN